MDTLLTSSESGFKGGIRYYRLSSPETHLEIEFNVNKLLEINSHGKKGKEI